MGESDPAPCLRMGKGGWSRWKVSISARLLAACGEMMRPQPLEALPPDDTVPPTRDTRPCPCPGAFPLDSPPAFQPTICRYTVTWIRQLEASFLCSGCPVSAALRSFRYSRGTTCPGDPCPMGCGRSLSHSGSGIDRVARRDTVTRRFWFKYRLTVQPTVLHHLRFVSLFHQASISYRR